MATSVEAGFNEFAGSICTSRTESLAAANHRTSIEAKLIAEFGMTAFFRTGSFGNGTNVSGCSDVDYFAVMPTSSLKQNSSLTLEAVATALRDRFPQTGVRVDAPGVRVPFGIDGAETTEIVPVDATGFTKLGFRQFDMPDGDGGWMFSAPESHNAFVSDIDKKLGGKVKNLIRFVKEWKFNRDVPIKSFYLEIRIAEYARREAAIVYDIDLKNIFHILLSESLRDHSDPRFPDDAFLLRACNSEVQRQDALRKLQNAYDWACEAVEDRSIGKEEAAFERWDLVFNYDFPLYG